MLKLKQKSDNTRPVITVSLMMGATILSKLLGMLRTVAMSNKYGTGIEAQAFSEASHIPLTLFDLAFGAAILGCFIPVYNSFRDNLKQADDFALVFLNLVLLATSALALLGIIFADVIISLMAPGLDTEVRLLAAKLLRIMFPMIIFTGATYTVVGVMQSKGHYLLPAVVSAISNGGVIIYLLFINDAFGKNGIYGLAAAYLVSWLLQLLTLAIPLGLSGFRYGFRFDFKNEVLRRSLKMAPSIILGSWLTPVSVLTGLYFASLVRIDGAVTIFDYAYTLFAIIAGVLTYSICNYAFPLLSKASGKEWSSIVSTGLIAAAAITLPFMGASMLLSREGVAVVCMHGQFTPYAAGQTAYAMDYMLLCLPAFACVEVCNRAFYSKELARIPMYAAVAGIAANIVSTALLVNVESLAVGAVGCGYAVGITASATVMLISLARRFKDVFTCAFAVNLLKLILCSAVAMSVMAVVYRLFGSDPLGSGIFKNIIVAAVTLLPGATVYLGFIKILKVKFKI